MEAMLREMVRRGWQPPSAGTALAANQPAHGAPILPLAPEQPIPVPTPLSVAAVETGEFADWSIEPIVSTAPAKPGAVPTAPAPPAQIEALAPEASAPQATDVATPANSGDPSVLP